LDLLARRVFSAPGGHFCYLILLKGWFIDHLL
jgi:hypothetical protein